MWWKWQKGVKSQEIIFSYRTIKAPLGITYQGIDMLEVEAYIMLQQYRGVWGESLNFCPPSQKPETMVRITVKTTRVTSVNSLLYGDDFVNTLILTTNVAGAQTKNKKLMSQLNAKKYSWNYMKHNSASGHY